jgi:hypothetical protein
MKKYLLLLAFVVGLSTQAFGFATIVTAIKGGDPITFTSNIQDVDVYLNGAMIGKYMGGSFTHNIKRTGQPQTFAFKKKGYKETVITVGVIKDPMFWGNALVGGFIGSSVDSWSTSNDLQYSPNQFYVEMKPL